MYKLYIGGLKDTSEKRTYYGEKYMLVYAEAKPQGDFREVPAQKESALTEDEKRWLNDCKIRINAEYLRENETTYAEIFTEFCKAFEKELKKEKRRAKNAEANDKT